VKTAKRNKPDRNARGSEEPNPSNEGRTKSVPPGRKSEDPEPEIRIGKAYRRNVRDQEDD
jgi:hypothetical protein